MAIEKVEIHFRGVCTHFHHNFIQGIPHLVVLPDATPAIPGVITGPWLADPSNPALWDQYLLMPHFPTLKIDGLEIQPFTTSGLFADDGSGRLITPSRLQIINTVDSGVSYPDGSFVTITPSLTTFSSNYSVSSDVVTGGRASAYFQIFGGAIEAFMDDVDKRVKVTINTDGPPQLQITAITTANLPTPTQLYKLSSDPKQPLLVGNVGTVCDDGRSRYDFLLHYLTAVAGIPRVLTAATPGMLSEDLCPPIEEALHELAKMGYPSKIFADFDTMAACSDSRYP